MVKRSLIAVGIVAMIAISGCGSSDDSASSTSANASTGDNATTTAEEGKKVTVILPSLANDVYLLEKAGAEAEAKAKYPNDDVSIVTGTGSSSAELVSKIEDAVTRGTDVIAINASDPKPVVPALKRAISQGVKVVVFDVPIPDLTDQTSFVGLNNKQGGELAGKWLAEHAGAGGELGILHCIPGLQITDERVAGFKEGLGEAPFKVVSTLDAKCDREKGRTTMENMLSAHPNLAAIYSISDTQTFGAVKAIEATGEDPTVVSFDAQPEALADIKAGKVIDASVGQFPYKVGALAVKTAADAAHGDDVPKEVFSPLVMVDKDNVGQFESQQKDLP